MTDAERRRAEYAKGLTAEDMGRLARQAQKAKEK